MSKYTPTYGMTESMETKVIKSSAMLRINAHDVIMNKLNTIESVRIVDAKFVEFADDGDMIFTATLIRPVENT